MSLIINSCSKFGAVYMLDKRNKKKVLFRNFYQQYNLYRFINFKSSYTSLIVGYFQPDLFYVVNRLKQLLTLAILDDRYDGSIFDRNFYYNDGFTRRKERRWKGGKMKLIEDNNE